MSTIVFFFFLLGSVLVPVTVFNPNIKTVLAGTLALSWAWLLSTGLSWRRRKGEMEVILEGHMEGEEGEKGNEWKIVLRTEEERTKEGSLRNQHTLSQVQ